MHKGFHWWKEQLLLLFFPHKCFLCGKVLSGSGWLCEHCTLPQTENLCLGCGKDKKNCICSRVSYDGAAMASIVLNMKDVLIMLLF